MPGTWKADRSSWRTAPRPKGWKTRIVPEVKRRDDGRCTWIEGVRDGGSWTMRYDPRRCARPGVDVDHMGRADDHRIEMLRLLCEQHHDHRTALQANAARWSKRESRKRKPEPHPGLVTQRHGVGGDPRPARQAPGTA
jgi:hypothetical protein